MSRSRIRFCIDCNRAHSELPINCRSLHVSLQLAAQEPAPSYLAVLEMRTAISPRFAINSVRSFSMANYALIKAYVVAMWHLPRYFVGHCKVSERILYLSPSPVALSKAGRNCLLASAP